MKENRLYDTEVPLQEILERMRKNTFNNFHNYSISSINKDYLKIRTAIFKIIQKITMKMGFKSQTYFLSIYYLDILFMKKKKININLYKLGLASLCVSAKFCENDPIVPQLQYFIKVYNNVMGYKNIISMSDLMYAEVLVCKSLNYKLNYYSIYDFNTFFFCHGILKLEQIKDIENEFKKNYNLNKKEFTINKLFVKNILGKIYKTTRNYLDTIIKIYKIIFKYNPLFVTIFILRKSIEEILADEFKKNYNKDKDNEQKEKEKEEFIKRNCLYFREIMNDFYKIDYESSEQYQQLILDDEINNIFKDKEKDKSENKKDENSNNNNNRNTINGTSNDNNNNKLLNSSAANGFYKRLKIPINEDINNAKKNKNIINIKKSNNYINTDNIEEDNLDTNLNINELRKSQIIKNEIIKNNNKLNKVSIPRINTYNTINNHNKTESGECDNKNTEVKTQTQTNSPSKSNKALNYKKINNKNIKKLKLNTVNEKPNNYINTTENIKLTTNKKKPYYKKFINLNNNKEILNSIINSIKSSTATNFYSNKINPLSTSNNQISSSYINAKNVLATENNNNNNENNNENNIYTYISSFHRRTKLINQQNKKKLINTSIGERYRRKIQNNLNSINNNNRDISPIIKNEKPIINSNYNVNSDKIYEKVKSSTSDNFYPRHLKKISVNLNKDSELKKLEKININQELQTERLSLLSKKNLILNNSLKEINNNFNQSITEGNNKNVCFTARNDNNDDNLYVNIVNKKNKANKFKKLNYKKIQKKIILDNNNNNNKNKKKNISNKNLSLNMSNMNKSNNKLITEKNKNNSLNMSNSKPITKRFSLKNNNTTNSNSSNNITDGPFTSRENESKSKEHLQDNFQSSIYKIIKKTKNFFTKNKKEEEGSNLLENKTKKIQNNNFYKSQQNFYKVKTDNKDKNSKTKNDIKIKENSYLKKAMNKAKTLKDKTNYNDKKNNSTIIINNNININIGNNSKNIKIPQLNLNNVILNSHSNYNINNNTQKGNNNSNINNSSNSSRKNINDLFHKLPFNKKIINKVKK